MNKIFTIKPARENKKLSMFIKKTKAEFENFFKFTVKEPPIFLLNSRHDMDIVWGKKTKEWFAGAVKNRNIYIFNPGIFSQVSSHKKDDFWQILKHEYCHVFFLQIANTNRPLWLNEGLACHLSGKKITFDRIEKEKFLGVFKYFDTVDKEAYAIGQFWVEKLIKKFGKTKLIELINELFPDISENDFAKKFQKIYKIKYNSRSFEKMAKNFLN